MPLSPYCQDPAHLYSAECQLGNNPGTYSPTPNDPYGGLIPNVAVIASPSTVWTGTGTYSRTLQSILSGLALWRGASAVPVPVQLQTAPVNPVLIGGGYGQDPYGGNRAAGGSAGSNFAGQMQLLIEKHPGTVAISGAIFVAFIIGQLKPKRTARGY